MDIVEIRPALQEDLSDIELCARKAYAKYVQRMDKEPAPMQANFGRQIADGCVHVATRESQFVGYVVFYPEGDHIHLENVAVLPAESGRGIGRQLIEHAERAARSAGLTAVELYTNEAMTENLSLYPNMGYVETNRKRQAGFNRVFYRKRV